SDFGQMCSPTQRRLEWRKADRREALERSSSSPAHMHSAVIAATTSYSSRSPPWLKSFALLYYRFCEAAIRSDPNALFSAFSSPHSPRPPPFDTIRAHWLCSLQPRGHVRTTCQYSPWHSNRPNRRPFCTSAVTRHSRAERHAPFRISHRDASSLV